jgi:peptidoglycan/xylan/chitin deacetylase (PgdA/CDA1 family)
MKSLYFLYQHTNNNYYNHQMSSIIFFTLSLLFIGVYSEAYYTTPRQNCSVNVPGTVCYNGPAFDSSGQYLSCSVPGTIAITFDDSPSIYTNHILDVLKEHNMKATFFVIGKLIHANHDIIQRMIDEGHQVGSHSYDHSDLNALSDPTQAMINFEISLVNEYFTGSLANGSIPNYMRSPYGDLNSSTYDIVRNQLGYLPVNWGFLTQDTDGIQESSIIPRYQSHLGGSSGQGVNASALELITQQHDTQQMTSNTFEDLTTYLQNVFGSQGVSFVTVAECLGNTVPAYRPNPRLQSELIPTTNPPSSSDSTSFPIWAIVLIAVIGAALLFTAVTMIYRCCHHAPDPVVPLPPVLPASAPPVSVPVVITIPLSDSVAPVAPVVPIDPVVVPPPLNPITPSPAPIELSIEKA